MCFRFLLCCFFIIFIYIILLFVYPFFIETPVKVHTLHWYINPILLQWPCSLCHSIISCSHSTKCFPKPSDFTWNYSLICHHRLSGFPFKHLPFLVSEEQKLDTHFLNKSLSGLHDVMSLFYKTESRVKS